ncbi:heme-binding protein 2-like [Montipora foliosa]|uniref:heme-binding protein 2-like n=1 Tax=Montipora foliosa TaxID=591990 RepID=UPI0035F1F673
MLSWLRGEEKPKVDTSEFHVPDSYRGSEGPRFKVLEKNEDYEARLYERSARVKTRFEEGNLENSSSAGFWRLFNYIRGENEGGHKIAMTVPVNSQVDLGEGDKCVGFTMGFYVPSEFQADPPLPKENTVFHETDESRVMYAAHFGGFAKEKDWKENVAKLKAALERDGKTYAKNKYMTAGHDPPFRLFGRHNEVLLFADPQPATETKKHGDGTQE